MQYAHFALSTFKVIWFVHLGCEGTHSCLLGGRVLCDYKLCSSQPQRGDLHWKPKVPTCPLRREALVHTVSSDHTSAVVQGGRDVKHIIPWTSLSLLCQIFAHQILAYQ